MCGPLWALGHRAIGSTDPRTGLCYGWTVAPRSWVRAGIDAPTFDQLTTKLSGSELQSLLMTVIRERAGARRPADVLSQYVNDGFCEPANVDLRQALAIDHHLFAAANVFEAIELSPVAPLGACSVVAATDQNRVLSALRTAEVVADPTNVLALECAKRLRAQPAQATHLATSQRLIRTQSIPNVPGYSRHFRMFALASGGRETKDHAFTVNTVVLHIQTMLKALQRLAQHGYTFGSPSVTILADARHEPLAERVADALPQPATQEHLDHPYYSGGLRYQIWTTASDGASSALVDGGTFDWLAKLTSNRRAVYVASGAGSQVIALRYKQP